MKITFLALYDICEPVFDKINKSLEIEFGEETTEEIKANELIDIYYTKTKKYICFDIENTDLSLKLESAKYPEILEDIKKILE